MPPAKLYVAAVRDTMDALIEEQVSGAAPGTLRDLRPAVKAMKALAAGHLDLAQQLAADTDAAVIIDYAVEHCRANPQPAAEQAQTLLAFFSRVLSNQFEGDVARWGTNVANVVLRDLGIVGVTTVLRQLAGMALASQFILEDLSPETEKWIGASMMLLGPCLNILGGIRDEVGSETATGKSRLGRGAMLGLSLSVLVAALAVNRGDPAKQMAAFGLQTLVYTTLRDMAQLVLPQKDNTISLNASSTALAGLGYGGTQVIASLLMDTFAPDSGAPYPWGVAEKVKNAAEVLMEVLVAETVESTPPTTSVADVRAKIVSAIKDLTPQWRDDFMRGLINAGGEAADDLLRPTIARHREVQSLIARTRAAAQAEGHDPEAAVANIPREQLQGLRIYFDTPRLPVVGSGFPTREQFLDQMLTTDAMRLSLFQALNGALLTVGAVLGNLGLSAKQQQWAGYAVLGGVVQLAYVPFLLAHDRRDPPAPAERPAAPNTVNAAPLHPPEPDTAAPTGVAPDDDNLSHTRF